MKNKMREILFGRDNKFNGLIALTVLGLFVLGCNCMKDLNKQPPPSNTTYPTNQGTVPATPTPKIKASVPTNSTGQAPTAEEAEAIVQESLQDFATGVDNGDFSTFHEKSSRGFKRTYTVDSVKTNFIAFVTQKSRVVPALRSTANLVPSFSPAPGLTTDRGVKVFRANGTYSTSPSTNFELDYVLEDKRWKVIGIRLRMQ